MPKKTTFTERWLQALKPKEKDYTHSEGHGFTIRVLPSGVKTFWFYYSLSGSRRKLNLGSYPDVSLATARDEHAKARLLVRQGIDPSEPLPIPIPEPEALTIEALADLWLKWSKENHVPKWANTLKLALEKDILPIYGARLASEIRRKDALAILEAKALIAPGQARNLHKALRSMWEHGKDRELVEYNPFAEIKVSKSIPTMKQGKRKRHLSDIEIKIAWKAIDEGGGSDSTRRAQKLILVTGQRPSEVTGMHSREIQLGIGKTRCQSCRMCGWWTIPEERRPGNKGGEHHVYLSSLAMELIGGTEGYICPGDDPSLPITENAVAYHVRREVKSTGKKSYYGLPRWTPHDLRRTASTGMARIGALPPEVDMVTGHALPGVSGIYNLHQYDREKQIWLTKWAEHLVELLDSR